MERHNPQWGCWCDKCSGNMCGCSCHTKTTKPQSEAKAILHAVEHPEEYCEICHKKVGVCKHTRRKRR